MLAQLGALLLSAVRHVIAPDLHACALPDFDELVVPVLALRNHALYDPLQPGHAFSLDLARLGVQLRKLLLPGAPMLRLEHLTRRYCYLSPTILPAQGWGAPLRDDPTPPYWAI